MGCVCVCLCVCLCVSKAVKRRRRDIMTDGGGSEMWPSQGHRTEVDLLITPSREHMQ